MPDMFLGPAGQERPNFKPPTDPSVKPISLLKPGSPQHAYVLSYLKDRLKLSEDKMTKFYPRWQIAERKVQAYMTLPNYEQMLKDMNDQSKPPAPAIILFPYKFAVLSTIVTYCLKVYCSRKPYFPLGASSKESADIVRYMESMVQWQLDASKMLLRIHQLLWDGELYGLAIMRGMWKVKEGYRQTMRAPSPAEQLQFANNPQDLPQMVRTRERKVVFAGTDWSNIDPFMFFPDPSVPMNEVSAKGEFVFWRDFVGKHTLIDAQQQGLLSYVDTVNPSLSSDHDTRWSNLSNRSVIAGGDSHAGDNLRSSKSERTNSYMVDQGSVVIIPAELGLSPSTRPEKWLFTILNKSQIVQAVPLDLDHDRHPVEVSEPYSMGYGFGQPAMSDYIGPLQDILSWFIDSHIYNIRSSLNNQWLYDPSKVNGDDLKYPQPGKHIRLKPMAYGTDVRTALTQFPVQDVTRAHMTDLSAFIRIGDMVSSVNDSMRGIPTPGRRTASDARMTNESAGGRLSSHAQVISEQCLTSMAEQTVMNIKQFQDAEIWTKVIGREQFAKVGQALLTEDFTYTIHDGTLPLDRVGGFELWKEVLMGAAQSPVLQQTHSLPRIFEHVCQLGGAPNITSFRLVSDQQMDDMQRAGNAIPLAQAGANAAAMQ